MGPETLSSRAAKVPCRHAASPDLTRDLEPENPSLGSPFVSIALQQASFYDLMMAARKPIRTNQKKKKKKKKKKCFVVEYCFGMQRFDNPPHFAPPQHCFFINKTHGEDISRVIMW